MTDQGALSGINVVEFSQNAAVPHCARLLAGMGARVVKIEPPEGDSMRHLAKMTETEGRAYALINPGKQAMCIDLSSAAARPVVDSLVAWADVVLIGLKRADLARFGLEWERLHECNPRAIVLELTAFGPEGPDADEGGYDVLAQGMSGLGFAMNRSDGNAPMPTRPAIFDFSSGTMASSAVCAALFARERTGMGQRIDISLLGTAMSIGTPMLGRFDRDAENQAAIAEEMSLARSALLDFDTQRELYESRVIAGAGAFKLYFRHYMTADGIVSVAALSPALIAKFHQITGLPSPGGLDPNDEQFKTVIAEAEALFLTRTTADWVEFFRGEGLPSARYNLPYEAVGDPQVEANDYVVDLEHPVLGRYRASGMPFQMTATPTKVDGPSPVLDADTDAVLAELGFDESAIRHLRSEGVVGRAAT